MPSKKHLKIYAAKQIEEIGAVKFNYGFPDSTEESTRERNYHFMASVFRGDLRSFRKDLEEKASMKDFTIDVPYDIDFVEIRFMGQFHIEKFYSIWYNTFGLEGVSFKDYNRVGLFAIADREKFEFFIKSLETIIAIGLRDLDDGDYSRNILFVRNFKLLSLSDVLQVSTDSMGNVVTLKTIELPANAEVESAILTSLEGYLQENEILYSLDKESNRIELFDIDYDNLVLIAKNFDLIESITSTMSGVVRPGDFNVPARDL